MWFGPPGRALFARCYVPDAGSARAGVVLCPPFGLEAQGAGRAYQVLCQRLASEGFAVARIDYHGTGDSAGSDRDPGRSEAWLASVRAGLDLVRGAGAERACVVGMRMGATVAAYAAEGSDLDALVLWDPCDSGRSYLREQALLRSVYLSEQGLDHPGHGYRGGVETLGGRYDAAAVRALTELTIESCPLPLARAVLALYRPERPPRRATRERLSQAGAETAEAVGQEELLSVWPLLSLVPEATISTIVDWLSSVIGPERLPVAFFGDHSIVVSPPPDEADADEADADEADADEADPDEGATATGPPGVEIVEEIQYLGPNRLFGILARPSVPRSAATVVLLNSGGIDHVGPGRLWVQLARSWAGAGFPVLRVDISGIGDSPVRPGQRPDLGYPAEGGQDVADIIQAVSPSGPSTVVLMGLCSGAYHSVQAARGQGALGVVAVNLVFPTEAELAENLSADNLTGSEPSEPAPAEAPARRSLPAPLLAAKEALKRAAQRPGNHLLGTVAAGLSDLKWRLGHRTGDEEQPALALSELVDRGVPTLVVCGPYEGRMVQQGNAVLLRKLQARGGLSLAVMPDIDHSLFTRRSRQQVLPLLTEAVYHQCAAAPAALGAPR